MSAFSRRRGCGEATHPREDRPGCPRSGSRTWSECDYYALEWLPSDNVGRLWLVSGGSSVPTEPICTYLDSTEPNWTGGKRVRFPLAYRFKQDSTWSGTLETIWEQRTSAWTALWPLVELAPKATKSVLGPVLLTIYRKFFEVLKRLGESWSPPLWLDSITYNLKNSGRRNSFSGFVLAFQGFRSRRRYFLPQNLRTCAVPRTPVPGLMHLEIWPAPGPYPPVFTRRSSLRFVVGMAILARMLGMGQGTSFWIFERPSGHRQLADISDLGLHYAVRRD